MRNLKRALSLLLAAIMLVGMMVVGASAADVYDSFADKDEIVNKDAVNLLTILEIINGKEDGSHFAPKDGVTRSEMAKMISVVLNKGRDNNDLYKNANTALTDISGHWAAGHINFCYQAGIIAGRGDNKFCPDEPVTASEAAKMLLVAAGYDPEIEGFVGANWAMNVNISAAAQGIYDNYTGDVMANLNRDDAALLIYNALDVEMIESYTANNYSQRYEDHRTILSSMYGVYKMKGVVIGNEWAQLEKTGIDDALTNGRTRVADISTYTSNTQATNTLPSDWQNVLGTTRTFNVSTPVNYLGKTVTMYIRKTTVLNDYEVLGVYLRDVDNDIVVKDASQSTTDALKGEGLKVDKDTEYYVNYGYARENDPEAKKHLGWSGKANGIDMELIDNDLDGAVDYVLYLKRDLVVVNTTREDVILRGYNNNKAIDEDIIVTDLDLTAGDVVLAVTYGGRWYIEAPEVVSGTMTAFSSSNRDNQTITVDGTDYKPSAIGRLDDTHTSANGEDNIADLDIDLCDKANGVQFNTTYDFFLDTHGYIRAFRPTEESLPQYALILESGYDPQNFNSRTTAAVTVLLADGTEGTYDLNFGASAANLASQLNIPKTGYTEVGLNKTNSGILELKGFLGTNYTDNSDTRPWLKAEGTVTNANYAFAYKNTDATEMDRAHDTYPANRAAGYVISYTLNSEDKMTIKAIIGNAANTPDPTAPNKNWNNFNLTDTQLKASTTGIHTLHTQGGALYNAYGTGDANVYYGANNKVIVDRNTVAFYYENADNYAVAVGYQNMAKVAAGKNFLASTVVRTSYNGTDWDYTDLNLADVIVFDECNVTTARDYAFVLSANTTNSDYVTLNVILEDGTASTLKMDRDDFEEKFPEHENAQNFKRAYAYTIDGKGYAKLYQEAVRGDGYKLKKGTVTIDGRISGYPYDETTIKIWDITDLDAGKDAPSMKDFTTNMKNPWDISLVLDSNGNVRTAFINVNARGGASTGAEAHDNHAWAWSKVSNMDNNYRTLLPVTSGSNNMNAADANRATQRNIQELLDDGYDVILNGDLALQEALNIPEDRILRIAGDLDVNEMRIYGNGSLTVTGDLDNASDINIPEVFVGTDWNLAAASTVRSDVLMYVGGFVGGAHNLTVASGADLHVGYNANGDYPNTEVDVTGYTGTVTVNGHMEVSGDWNGGAFVVNSAETLIVHEDFTVTTLTIGKTGAGTVTVNGTFTGTTVAMPNAGSRLELNGINNVITNNAAQLTGVSGARIVFGSESSLSSSDASGIKWTPSTEVEDAGTAVGGVTFTFDGNNTPVASGSDAAAVESVVVNLAHTNGEYVKANDASNPTSITFKKGASDHSVRNTTVTVTTVPADATVTVTGDTNVTATYSEGTITITAPTAGKTGTVTIKAAKEGYQNIEKTITVTNEDTAGSGK